MDERGERRRSKQLRDCNHRPLEGNHPADQRQPGLVSKILHSVLHQVHKVNLFYINENVFL